jgi:aminopeptidase N
VPVPTATLGGGSVSAVVTGPATTVRVKGCGTMVLNQGKGSYMRAMYDASTHAAIVRDYRRLQLNDRLGTLGDDFALAAGGYQDLGRWFAVMEQVDAAANPLEWATVTSGLRTLQGLYQGTPLEAPMRARVAALLGPQLKRIGYEGKVGEAVLVTNLRETLFGRLGASGDPDLAARARTYVAALRTDPTAIPPAIRQPILSTYAVNATVEEWDQLLALALAEKSPVARNRFVTLLGVARDQAVARKAFDLLLTEQITPPQKASLLRALGGSHSDLAFDWAVARRETVESWLEESTKSGFIASLGGGSSDPAMPGKLRDYAAKYPMAGDSVQRTIAGIAVRKAAADRLRAATARWLGVAGS